MRLRIATWNINSIRKRVAQVRRFLRQSEPDVLCLQETKVVDELFPRKAFEELGYANIVVSGQKSYNGVAIISRLPLQKVTTRNWCNSGEKRYLRATLPQEIDLHNFYIPAGGEEPNPKRNPKFKEKLRFFKELEKWFSSAELGRNRILLGDLNVAPLKSDVWSHEKLMNVVSHTPIEIEHYNSLFSSHDWVDAVRFSSGSNKKIYSWWSYRSSDWKKTDKGRRLDHIWVTEALKHNIVSAELFKRPRGWKQPSDHIPTLIELKI